MNTPLEFDRENAWHALRVLEAFFEFAGAQAERDRASLEEFLGEPVVNGVADLVQLCRMAVERDIFPDGVPSLGDTSPAGQ